MYSFRLCSPATRPWFLGPERSLLPREALPSRLPLARVRVAPHEWDRVVTGLYDRNIVEFFSNGQRIFHNSAPLLDGLFGVPKGFVLDDSFSLSTCPLRAISNAIPSNSVQLPIAGEIADLPLHMWWHSWELEAGKRIVACR